MPAPPPGFDEWLIDLEATAAEGTEALKAAWSKSQPYLRKHLTDSAAGQTGGRVSAQRRAARIAAQKSA